MAARARIAAQALSVGLVAALLGLLVWKLVHDEASRPERGGAAPAFSLPVLGADDSLSLAAFRGKAIVVNFWASWCVPCKDEAPFLERTWQEYRDEGLVVLGVNYNDFRSDALKFVRDTGITYPSVVDREGKLVDDYGLRGVPETFVVGRDGKLVGEPIAGPVDDERFAARFRSYVEEALGT
jgi:cytochrome c biogenesis protein CcmG/thiol:disulfide interchange protein DsbE